MSPNPSRETRARVLILVKITALAAVMLAAMLSFLIFPNGQASADPLYVARETLVASNAASAVDANLGSSAAVSGDTVVLGAPNDGAHGVVYIYARPTTGWTNLDATETATLTLPADEAIGGESFGNAVSISGDTIIVGARGENGQTGAAYVFVRPESGWSSTTDYAARLTYDPGVAVAGYFGDSVDISGDTIVVGASGAGTSGRAFVFERPPTGWETVTATVELSNGAVAETDYFGISVAVNADTVVVGADSADVDGEVDQGAVYVFEKPGDNWSSLGTPTALLTSTGNAGDFFGAAVDIREDGKAIVVGAPIANRPGSNTGTTQGAAYVFMRPGDSWSAFSGGENAVLSLGANGSPGDRFGDSVAISHDTIVVGASGVGPSQGAAFVYVQPRPGLLELADPAMAWDSTDSPDATVNDSNGASQDKYGSAVATFGGTIVVGSPNHTVPGANASVKEQGYALVFENSFCSAQSGAWGDTATWVGPTVPTETNDACISTGHIVSVVGVAGNSAQQVGQADVEVRRLLVNPGGKLDLGTATIAVSETVQNSGMMMQQQFQTGGMGPVQLLNIESNTTGTVFRGAEVDSEADLGGVTLTLRSAIDWFSPTSYYNYCTSDGAASNPYAKRCFEIEATTSQPATVTLWARLDELNGIDVPGGYGELVVYRYAGGTWGSLTPADYSDSFLGYINVSGPTPGFSFFLIGDQNNEPTAVDLIGFRAGSPTGVALPLFLVTGLLAFSGAGVLLWRRRQRTA